RAGDRAGSTGSARTSRRSGRAPRARASGARHGASSRPGPRAARSRRAPGARGDTDASPRSGRPGDSAAARARCRTGGWCRAPRSWPVARVDPRDPLRQALDVVAQALHLGREVLELLVRDRVLALVAHVVGEVAREFGERAGKAREERAREAV